MNGQQHVPDRPAGQRLHPQRDSPAGRQVGVIRADQLDGYGDLIPDLR
ncbi:MAG: hypothetical protein M3467_00885 [Actinomycetota bacterium]|nr:hypothetical protein [Actinomycetota bacterium]